jgi:PAS domain-containing protein
VLQDGTTLGAVLIFRDITTNRMLERRALRSAQEAAERAAELEAIFGSIADGLLVYDSRGRILRMNALDRQLALGDPEATDLPKTIDERAARAPVFDSQGYPIPRDLAPTTRTLKGETFGGANALDLVTTNARGERIRINVAGAPMRDTSGEIIGGVVVWRDVTVRHRLDQQLKERAQELEAIIESIADPVIVYHPDGNIRHMNASALRMLGFTPDSPDALRSRWRSGPSCASCVVSDALEPKRKISSCAPRMDRMSSSM